MQIVNRIRRWRLVRKANRAIRVLDALDWQMKQLGRSRHERRRFWREYIKSDKLRTGVLNKLTG